MMPQRHHLIYLKPQAPFQLMAPYTNQARVCEAIHQWLLCGLPCIYTRQMHEHPRMVSLGLTVLVEQTMYRVGLMVAMDWILRMTPLPRLGVLQACFPGVMPPVFGCESMAFYGSFLFEYLSQSTRVHPASDLDLLIAYDQASLAQLKHHVDALEHATMRRVDGELRFPGIGDLAIRELIFTQTKELLIKTTHNLKLMSRQTLYEYYPALLSAV